MYKFIILDTKRKKKIGYFLKHWPSSHGFNKLVIKAKMHAKTYIFWIFVVWKYDMIFFFYLWETWLYVWKQDIFFVYNILQCFDENRVF
jgi:hypothetical protein